MVRHVWRREEAPRIEDRLASVVFSLIRLVNGVPVLDETSYRRFLSSQPTFWIGRWLNPLYGIQAHPFLFALLQGRAGNGSISSHSRKVQRRFDGAYRTGVDWAAPELRNKGFDIALFRLILALHDIGKPLSIKFNGHSVDQHAYTVPIMRHVLTRMGVSEDVIKIAVTLVGNDLLGHALVEADRRFFDRVLDAVFQEVNSTSDPKNLWSKMFREDPRNAWITRFDHPDFQDAFNRFLGEHNVPASTSLSIQAKLRDPLFLKQYEEMHASIREGVIQEAATKLLELSGESGLSLPIFFQLLNAYYLSDAGSHPWVRHQRFQEDGIRLKPEEAHLVHSIYDQAMVNVDPHRYRIAPPKPINHVSLADFRSPTPIMYWMPFAQDMEGIGRVAYAAWQSNQEINGLNRVRPLIIDVGAGSGFLAYLIARYWDVDVIAFEPEADRVAQAKKNYGDNPRLRFITGTADDVPGWLTDHGIAGPDLVINSWMPHELNLTDAICNIGSISILYFRGFAGQSGSESSYDLNKDWFEFGRWRGISTDDLNSVFNECGITIRLGNIACVFVSTIAEAVFPRAWSRRFPRVVLSEELPWIDQFIKQLNGKSGRYYVTGSDQNFAIEDIPPPVQFDGRSFIVQPTHSNVLAHA